MNSHILQIAGKNTSKTFALIRKPVAHPKDKQNVSVMHPGGGGHAISSEGREGERQQKDTFNSKCIGRDDWIHGISFRYQSSHPESGGSSVNREIQVDHVVTSP